MVDESSTDPNERLMLLGLIIYTFVSALAVLALTVMGLESPAVVEFFKITGATALGSIATRFNAMGKKG